MKNKYFKVICLSFLLLAISASAQTFNSSRNSSFIENVRFGGGVGLSFGNDFFSGTLAPFALYQINPFLMSGAGLNVTYSSFNDNDTFVYGGSLIGIAKPLKELQFSLEYEQLRVNRSFNNGVEDDYWYPALFIGVGYTSGPVTVGIRYDVLYDSDKSIYADAYMPFVRVLF
ncbi:MAG: alpha-ketoglutarate decarboxylase [Bacteroidetes bacterium]|jgi:hypothetical protein|nr:alpha-ketoglutarate decarboxylase [Bacteroidota bacterium]